MAMCAVALIDELFRLSFPLSGGLKLVAANVEGMHDSVTAAGRTQQNTGL